LAKFCSHLLDGAKWILECNSNVSSMELTKLSDNYK